MLNFNYSTSAKLDINKIRDIKGRIRCNRTISFKASYR